MTVVWAKGGTARILKVSGEAVTLRSTIPSPPGSRLDAMLGEIELRIKVHGSKREDDGSFTITGRLVDATREVRERVSASAAEPE